MALGLDKARCAEQLGISDAIVLDVLGDLFELGLLFLLLDFVYEEVQLSELLLQLANGRVVHEGVS
ncbi:hypothetical protein WT61_07260 [Burkholderia stagnalis]|nr:hypothetical protein WT61_07260 [Burkholderia stagnalis]KWH59106.1 hypothetical protein WT62_02980 [Burkholderia stagnalis]